MIRQTVTTLALASMLAAGVGTEALGQGMANPCAAKNPCAKKTAGAATKDKAAEAAFKQYKGWKKVNEQPVKSESHGNTLVFTSLNKRASRQR